MIELSHIHKTYSRGEAAVHALRDVSLDIRRGEFIAIMGPSGSGKSTLMHLIGLLDRADSGEYRLAGRDISRLSDDERAELRSAHVGFVFQQFHLLPRTTARANVAMPLLYSTGETNFRRAEEVLREVGLGSRLLHRPGELSGGQQQRVAMARALVNSPDLILADEPTGNLDSASAAEIMEGLADLNRHGKTILLVTHEADIARYARRVLHMRDGRIQSEERVGDAGSMEAGLAAWAFREPTARAALLRAAGLAKQAFRNLAANKVRSGLSMLGILIGVAAVIAMLALGAGAKLAIERQLASLGSNALVLMPGAERMHGVAAQAGSVTRISVEDVRALRQAVPSIARVAPMVMGRAQAVYGSRNWNTQVIGSTPDYAPMRASVPQVGRFISDQDVSARLRVAVIGMTVWRELFGDANPIGQFLRLNRISFQVVGILPEKGTDRWRDQDDVVIVPLSAAMCRLLGRPYVDAVNIEIAAGADIGQKQEAIKTFMRQRHRVSESEDEPFTVRNLSEIRDMLSATSRTMSLLLAVIAVISLIVGGIGIMNIMLVSVTERTREIGLRKAVGARSRDVRLQFLIEAVVISLVGGVAGILLGASAAYAMSQILDWSVSVSAASVLLAFLFSAFIGILFGLWPAHQAARLDPIEALRYE
jgi:macrolide transport system ATP-binding/permease protein